MTQASFRFISDADDGDRFRVVSFEAQEAISSPYRYEIELKAPVGAHIALDDILDNSARFVTVTEDAEYPVYGILAAFDELQTAQGFVHYKAVLVPRLWWLSIYRTNEIYTYEKTVDEVIETVLTNAGLAAGADYDLRGLDTSRLLRRDYRCQFGESDLDFLSRLMENEGIYYYFEQGDGDPASGACETIVFAHDMNYPAIPGEALVFDAAAQSVTRTDRVHAWSCHKRRLAAQVTVRDYNPDLPSLDISDSMDIDRRGRGTEYIYGEHIVNEEEATYLSGIRAEEKRCQQTRFHGECAVPAMCTGYTFALAQHPNGSYNDTNYLAIRIERQGSNPDIELGHAVHGAQDTRPHYRSRFEAIRADVQFRPDRRTPKPRFYGTMTAFVYAEIGTNKAELDAEGRYRVHLPFDRADGTKDSKDPDRKASTWIRMAQPYVGQEQGMYFPLTGGTEVLLTFVNGDPDQPIISGALPNGSQPSLLSSEANFVRNVTTDVVQVVSGNTHAISLNSNAIARNTGAIDTIANPPPAPNPTVQGRKNINEGKTQNTIDKSMLPPWSIPTTHADYDATEAYDAQLIKFKRYDTDLKAHDMVDSDLLTVSTDRCGGDNYIYANARTFAYPEHERVYFIGTFHEDFHVSDDFTEEGLSWTGKREVFHFPCPGGDATQTDTSTETDVNPTGIRGVTETRVWGDQMNYSWGRSFNWGGGPGLGNDGGAGECFNYGNSYTENLLEVNGYTLRTAPDIPAGPAKTRFDEYVNHKNDWTEFVGERAARLKDGKTLQAGTLAAEKTFGNTYSYQMGYAVDIHEGHSLSKSYGDTDEYVGGNTKSFVVGTTDATYHGQIHEYTMAGKAEFNLAACSTISLAESFEIYGGLKQEFDLAANLECLLGGKAELALALTFEYFGGVKTEIAQGAKIEADLAVTLEKASAKLKKVMTEIQDTEVTIALATACVLTRQSLSIDMSDLDISL